MVYPRIFLFGCLLCFFQIVNAKCYDWTTYDKVFKTPEAAFAYWATKDSGKKNHSISGVEYTNNGATAWVNFTYEWNSGGKGNSRVGFNGKEVACDCPKKPYSRTATLRRNGELFAAPSQLCISKCLYDFKDVVIGQEVRNDGHITTVFVGDAHTLEAQCDKDTEDDKAPPINPCKSTDAQGNIVSKDYCDAPPDGCPSGYISGMFNGKKICVKQDQNDKDNCKPTVADPYKCMPNKPDEPKDPDKDNNCSDGKIQVIIGSTLKCVTPEVPPNPDGSCPSGYVKQTYDGISTCVPDNQRPDAGNNCPLNTSLTTLSDGTKVCKGNGNNNDGGGSASEPTGGDGDGTGGNGSCDPKKDFLCADADFPDVEKLAINDMKLPEIKENKVSWSKSCPAPINDSVTVLSKTVELKFEFTKACSILSDYINPLVVAFGYLSAAFIVIGSVRK